MSSDNSLVMDAHALRVFVTGTPRAWDRKWLSLEESCAAWQEYFSRLWHNFPHDGNSANVAGTLTPQQVLDALGGYITDHSFHKLTSEQPSYLRWVILQQDLGMPWWATHLLRETSKGLRPLSRSLSRYYHAAHSILKDFTASGACRDYYWKVHVFDPLLDFLPLPEGGYCYDAEYPLANDPHLAPAGVTISARVCVTDKAPINLIIFRCGDRSAAVHCTHTIIQEGEPAWALNFASDAVLQRTEPSVAKKAAILPVWEHFLALRSYVAGVAEVGIEAMLMGVYHTPRDENPAEMLGHPFGFNAAMQKQILEALRAVAPEASRSLAQEAFLHLVETASREWVLSRLPELDRILNLQDAFFEDPAAFEAVEDLFITSDWFLRAFLANPMANVEIIGRLLAHVDDLLQWARGRINAGYPMETRPVLRLLAEEYSTDKRVWSLLGEVLQMFGEYEASVEAWDHVTQLDPRDAGAWQHLRELFHAHRDLPRAIMVTTRIASLVPEDPEPWFQLGMLYKEAELWSEAGQSLERHVELAPDSTFGWHVLGEVYRKLGDETRVQHAENRFLQEMMRPRELPPHKYEVAFRGGKLYTFRPTKQDPYWCCFTPVVFLFLMLAINTFAAADYLAGAWCISLLCALIAGVFLDRLRNRWGFLQVAPDGIHYRILRRHAFLPWGSSVLERLRIESCPRKGGKDRQFVVYRDNTPLRRFDVGAYELRNLDIEWGNSKILLAKRMIRALEILVSFYQSCYLEQIRNNPQI